jgi:hypothetical protein
MWGQHWDTMIWGRAASVPALSWWGVLLLGAVLGGVGVQYLRKARPRTIGLTVLALALAIPLSARALPFTFTNGTVADANQVNANFAALVPVTGFSETRQAAAMGQENVLGPSFTAPRAMTCVMSIGVDWIPQQPSSIVAFASAIKVENGVLTPAFAPPDNTVDFVGLVAPGPSVPNNETWQSNQTRLFTVSAGSTVQFGTQIQTNSAPAAGSNFLLVLVYSCQ